MKFRVRQHTARKGEMVEVFDNTGTRFIAAIYPNEEGLHIVSKHITSAVLTEHELPSVLVQLNDEALR